MFAKTAYLKLSLVCFSLVFTLVLLEICLRLFTPIPDNLAKLKSSSLFLHENNPNVTFTYKSQGEFENQIFLNSYGFRDDEFKREKEPDTFRIAVLGDSQEEALQVTLFDTWQKVMVRRLSEKLKVKVESYNFGISGYGTDQQWLTLREKVWQFSPDMVILAFSPNDVGDTYKNKLVRLENGSIHVVSPEERAGGNFLGKIVRKTYIYQLVVRAASGNEFAKKIVDKVRTKILGFPKDERFFLSDAQLISGPFEIIASQKNPPQDVLDTWNIERILLADMEKQAEAHGAKFMVTVNIPRAQVDTSSWEQLRDQYHLAAGESLPYQINEVLGGICLDLGIPFYDGRLDAIEWKNENGILHFPNDAHYNINGNLFMGTKTADFILKSKLIGE